jgi:hypothetical protein
MKTLIGEVLPFEFSEFMDLVKSFFGTKVFDLKEIIKFCNGLNGDLEMETMLFSGCRKKSPLFFGCRIKKNIKEGSLL